MATMLEEALTLRRDHEARGAMVDLTVLDDEICLDLFSLPVDMQRQGYGSGFMRELCEVADRSGVRVSLEASSYHHPKHRRHEIAQGPLEDFYRRFGFEITGIIGAGGRPEMIRPARPSKETIS